MTHINDLSKIPLSAASVKYLKTLTRHTPLFHNYMDNQVYINRDYWNGLSEIDKDVLNMIVDRVDEEEKDAAAGK